MGDATLADPVTGVRLNQASHNALGMETFESGVSPRPVELSMQNHLQSMSMDDVVRLADARIAEQRDRAFIDTFGMSSGTTSLWSLQSERGYEELERVTSHQVKFLGHKQMDEDLGWGNADWKGQTPLATGVWENGLLDVGRHKSRSEQEIACRVAAVTERGSETPGVAVNSVALRLPLVNQPSHNQSAKASGCYQREVLTKVSARAKLMAARKDRGKVAYSKAAEYKMLIDIQGAHGVHVRRMHTVKVQARNF